MGIQYKLGKMSPLEATEKVLHVQKDSRALTGTAIPNYRIAWPSEKWLQFVLYVTDRRCLVVTEMFGKTIQEIDMWYPGKQPDSKTDIIYSAQRVDGLFGEGLEIRSRDPRRPLHWPLLLWSPNMTLRFFFKDPEGVANLIQQAMGNATAQ